MGIQISYKKGPTHGHGGPLNRQKKREEREEDSPFKFCFANTAIYGAVNPTAPLSDRDDFPPVKISEFSRCVGDFGAATVGRSGEGCLCKVRSDNLLVGFSLSRIFFVFAPLPSSLAKQKSARYTKPAG